jgi:hypothetical protein
MKPSPQQFTESPGVERFHGLSVNTTIERFATKIESSRRRLIFTPNIFTRNQFHPPIRFEDTSAPFLRSVLPPAILTPSKRAFIGMRVGFHSSYVPVVMEFCGTELGNQESQSQLSQVASSSPHICFLSYLTDSIAGLSSKGPNVSR